jgi:hypothetical protein
MNIFACDNQPETAARHLPDKLVVKMPLECAQMLCTVAWKRGKSAPYKPTHLNHPCVVWVGKTAGNWRWLVEHGLALCQEYTRRYNKIHASESVIEQVAKFGPKSGELEPFVLVMPDEYKKWKDPIKCYRAFLVAEKTRYATWRKPSVCPKWWKA